MSCQLFFVCICPYVGHSLCLIFFSVHLFFRPYIGLSIVRLSIVRLSNPFIYHSVLFSPSINLSVHHFVHHSVCPPICPSFCLSIHLSVFCLVSSITSVPPFRRSVHPAFGPWIIYGSSRRDDHVILFSHQPE